MNTQFKVNVSDQNSVAVEQLTKSEYIAEMDGQQIHIMVQKDNDGANRWIEKGKDHETNATQKIGLAIEAYLANKKQLQ